MPTFYLQLTLELSSGNPIILLCPLHHPPPIAPPNSPPDSGCAALRSRADRCFGGGRKRLTGKGGEVEFICDQLCRATSVAGAALLERTASEFIRSRLWYVSQYTGPTSACAASVRVERSPVTNSAATQHSAAARCAGLLCWHVQA